MQHKAFGAFGKGVPSLIAATGSLVPSLLAVVWKFISPGYGCYLRNPSQLGTLGSPCFGVTLLVAYCIGWVVGKITDRIRDRRAGERAAAAELDRVDLIGRITAGAIGLVLGIPFGLYVLNPCP